METQILLFCVLGGIVSLDTDAVGQFMISQPLVACTCAGVIFGNAELGALIGLLLQLPYLTEIPAGGARISMGNLGALVAAGLTALLSQTVIEKMEVVLFLSLLYGVLLSWLGIPLLRMARQINEYFVNLAEKRIAEGRIGSVTVLNYCGAINSFLFGILWSGIFLFIGKYTIASFTAIFPSSLEAGLHLLKPILIGAGAGAMLWLFTKKKMIKFTLVGATGALLLIGIF